MEWVLAVAVASVMGFSVTVAIYFALSDTGDLTKKLIQLQAEYATLDEHCKEQDKQIERLNDTIEELCDELDGTYDVEDEDIELDCDKCGGKPENCYESSCPFLAEEVGSEEYGVWVEVNQHVQLEPPTPDYRYSVTTLDGDGGVLTLYGTWVMDKSLIPNHTTVKKVPPLGGFAQQEKK